MNEFSKSGGAILLLSVLCIGKHLSVVKQLRTIQQRHLQSILKIHWFDFVANEEVLAKSDVVDIEVLLAQSRLRWLGHVSRMEDNRTCKRLLYGELADGSRPIGRPKLRFKDNCKSILKTGNILHNWNDTVKDYYY